PARLARRRPRADPGNRRLRLCQPATRTRLGHRACALRPVRPVRGHGGRSLRALPSPADPRGPGPAELQKPPLFLAMGRRAVRAVRTPRRLAWGDPPSGPPRDVRPPPPATAGAPRVPRPPPPHAAP